MSKGGCAFDIDFGPSSSAPKANAKPVDPYERRPPPNRSSNSGPAPRQISPGRQGQGRVMPLSLSAGRRSGSGTTGALTTKPTPQQTAFELQKNYQGPAKTAKGRAIQQDLQDLGDDYFGGVESRAPPSHAASTPEDSVYARYTKSYSASAVPRQWRTGPRDSTGRIFDASDSNLLCMDVMLPESGGGKGPARQGRGASSGGLVVVGSADHGLKVFDIETLREKKNLYTKTCGHTEWVTTCKFLRSGMVISGGMDSKLCLWDPVNRGGPARCRDLLGHTGSISQVEVNDCSTAISASYDRTLRIWDCDSAGRELGCLAGHKAPVMQFAWSGTQVISGDRQGQAKVWDLNTASAIATLATKRGQIGALAHLLHRDFGNLTMFGDQGGVLTVLDLRDSKTPVFQGDLHPGGVLSGIKTISDEPYVVTCGADRRILVLDPRRNYEAVHEFTDHQDFIYSMETFGDLVLSGAGNGWLLVHDTKTGKCCYGLGANAAAVREIRMSPSFLICAGDDGKASVYDF